jgi:hypothetical protein
MGIVRFGFETPVDAEELEGDIALAILCAECIYGRPRVRMEVSYAVDPHGKACVLETAGVAGEAVARVFAGLLAVRLGENAYSVRRQLRDEANGHEAI